ncbi:MAG: hypothetical protein GXO90_03645 [FCB group bacterium]|nr:hypothetical protein [FCB group bacterium]
MEGLYSLNKPIYASLAIVFIIGCIEEVDNSIIDENFDDTTAVDDTTLHNLSPSTFAWLDVNDISIQVDTAGQLREGILRGANGATIAYHTYFSGLWVGHDDPYSPSANITWVGTRQKSNYTSHWPDGRFGVYRIVPAYINPDSVYWPIDKGFPVTQNGGPFLIGDLMLWSALKADTLVETSILASPIPNMTYTQTVWAYERDDLRSTIFISYTLRNTADTDINGIRIGFYSDTDLSFSGGSSGSNSTGYDSSQALTYTYIPSDTGSTFVCGFTFLEVNGITDPGQLVTSHRIMRKNNYIDSDFGEYGFDSPEQILFALKGLSNTGQPMIDPTTGEPTLFAFSGDPVAGTGWLDVQVDVRSLLNGPELSLVAHGQVRATLVFTITMGTDLRIALINLKRTINDIRNEPDLWIFY